MFRCLLCKFYLFLTHVCCLFSAHKVLFHFTQYNRTFAELNVPDETEDPYSPAVDEDQADRTSAVCEVFDDCAGDKDLSFLRRKQFARSEKCPLQGDNLKLYLGSDAALVQQYRKIYREREEWKTKSALHRGILIVLIRELVWTRQGNHI